MPPASITESSLHPADCQYQDRASPAALVMTMGSATAGAVDEAEGAAAVCATGGSASRSIAEAAGAGIKDWRRCFMRNIDSVVRNKRIESSNMLLNSACNTVSYSATNHS